MSTLPPETILGKNALITGASSGLGADFARELARRGCNLVLSARRAEALNALQTELTAAYPVRVYVRPADLSAPAARAALFAGLEAEQITVDILINNAGFGYYGDFLSQPWERDQALIDLDIAGLVHLTKLFTPAMKARGYGRVLQVASVAAYQPSPTYAVYAAAKSFVLSFGIALNHELRGSGVSCTVLSPGVTATEFLTVAGQASPTRYQRVMMMRSPVVVRAAVRAMLARRSSVTPGFGNAFFAWGVRFLPRSWAAALADWTLNAL